MTTQPVDAAITAIGTVVATVSGMEQVLVNPTETANADLFAVVYAAEGRFDIAATKQGLHNIYIDVLKRRTDLAADIAALKPFIDTVPAALMAQVSGSGARFANTIQTFGGITYRLTYDDYAGSKVIGYRFIMEQVKILSNL